MATNIHVEIVSREIVKPSSSSTLNNHPSFYNASFFDQFVSCVYMPFLFFYTNNKNGKTDEYHISSVLKTSLSAALSHYYPLAGRVKDYATVHCNDEGSLFLEAKIECGLSDLLHNPDPETLKVLLPDDLYGKDSASVGPVVVQVTYFECGGMSIGLCLCHKNLDMASMTNFIYDWASLARKSGDKISPEFNVGSLYPPIDRPILKHKLEDSLEMKGYVSRRFVFHGSKIDNLKEMVEDQVQNPTRVEVVASLLYKLLVSANAKASNSGSLKPSTLHIAMNLRNKIPGISERHIGNIVGKFEVCTRDEREIELGFLVKQVRNAKTQYSNLCASKTNSEDLSLVIFENLKPPSENLNVDHESYTVTSWCRYRFYETDFGWGKPLWASTIPLRLQNSMVFLDTKEGDGIEVFISLEEKVMAIFENDQELLSFTSVNPSLLDPVV